MDMNQIKQGCVHKVVDSRARRPSTLNEVPGTKIIIAATVAILIAGNILKQYIWIRLLAFLL